MSEIHNCFYRVSIKGLILNETRDKFLLTKETDGKWGLPGGGLDWGTRPHEDLAREMQEEMGLAVTYMSPEPVYFLGGYQRGETDIWIINIVYEVTVEHLCFTPSDECLEIMFVDASDIQELPVVAQIIELASKFKPENHK